MAKRKFDPVEQAGVSLKVVVKSCMKQIGKTMNDVKDVKWDGNFITVQIKGETEPLIINTAPPGEDFPTQH